jgi:hypothetical protein
VILMRVGEQAQVLNRLEKVTDDLNRHVLPADVPCCSMTATI